MSEPTSEIPEAEVVEEIPPAEESETPIPATPVAGYRQPEQWQLQLVNNNKVVEERLLRMIEGFEEMNAETEGKMIEPRDLALGKRKLIEAFMWINRSIMRPQRLDVEG